MTAPADDRELLTLMLGGWRAGCLLEAALTHGVFAHLASPGVAVPELAERLGWDERGLRLLLTALRSLGLVDRSGERYVRTPLAADFLDAASPRFMGNWLNLGLYGPRDLLAPLWNDLAGNLRAGGHGRFAAPQGREATLDYLRTLWDKSHRIGLARFVAERFPAASRRRLLDVGGGSGVHSFALAERHPQLHATVFDLPDVTALAAELNAARPGADRIDYAGGDFFAGELPVGHDAALLANVVHDWTEAQNRRIIEGVARALEPGGAIGVCDVTLRDDASGPLYAALFGIDMFLVSEGEAYAGAQIAAWLRDAGFRDIAVIPDDRSPYTLVTATKLA